MIFAIVFTIFVLFSTSSRAASGINNQINYQARLMDASGFPVTDGTYSVKFSLYDAPIGGTRIWTATGTTAVPTAINVSVANGLFTVLLGDPSAAGGWQNSLNTVDWNSDNLYLGVTIGADAEMTPRKRLAAAPQAFNSRQLQGMYASGTAFGGNSLFTINQTSNTAATGTRTALAVRSMGTSSTNDYLIQAFNDIGAAVFNVNREGNITIAGYTTVNGATTSTFAHAVSSTSAEISQRLTVGGKNVCLDDGTNCNVVPEADTLATVSNRGNFATSSLLLYGGASASTLTATSTLTANGNVVLGDAIADTITFNGRSASSLLPDTDLAYSLGSSAFRWDASFGNATATTFAWTNASGSSLLIAGQSVCLADGTNCTFYSITDLNWAYDSASDFVRNNTSTTDLVLGSSATSTGAPAYFNLSGGRTGTSNFYFGHATSANVIIGGTSTTVSHMHADFALNGNDLYVSGNIGAATSIYTNGEFVAGNASTRYGNGYATRANGTFTVTGLFGVYLNASNGVTAPAIGSFGYDGVFITPQQKVSGAGGSINLIAGNAIGTNNAGGGIALTAGNATGTSSGGSVAISAGDSGNSFGPFGGNVSISAGDGVVGSGNSGGSVDINGGSADLTGFGGVGGPVTITGGDSTVNAGGAINLYGGQGYSGAAGGAIYLRGGDDALGGSGGNIQLQSGSGTTPFVSIENRSDAGGPSTELRLLESNANGLSYIGFKAPDSLGGNQIWTLPSADGASNQAITTNGVGTLGFTSVCLSDGTGCPSGALADINWAYNAASDFVRNNTSTTDLVLGSSATSTGAPAYFNLSGGQTGTSDFYFGHATSANVIIGGTSTTVAHMNAQFALNGNDLYVSGNIGSASSVYTNGEFVVGPASTHYGDTYVQTTAGNYSFDIAGGFLLPSTDLSVSLGSASQKFNGYFGSVTSTGDFTATGNTELNTVSILGAISTDLVTPFNEVHSLGTSSFYTWDAYLRNVTATNMFVVNGGTTVFPPGTSYPDANVVSSSTIVGGNTKGIYVQGRNMITVSGSTNAIEVVDFSDPSAPYLVASSSLPGVTPSEFSVENDRLVISGTFGAVGYVWVHDISDITTPTLVGKLTPTASTLGDVAVAGSYAYAVASADGALYIIDISDPTLPRLVKTVTGLGTPSDVKIQGGYAYVTEQTTEKLVIIDISDPFNAKEVGSLIMPVVNPLDVLVQGNRAYVSYQSNTSYTVVDVSDPATPYVVTTRTCANVACNDNIIAGDILLQKGYRSLGAQHQTVRFVDISSSSTPSTISEIQLLSPSENLVYMYKTGDLLVAIQSATAFGASTSVVSFIDTGGIETDGIRAASAEIGTAIVRTNLQVGRKLSVGDGLSVGEQGILSQGGIGVMSTSSRSFFAGHFQAGELSVTGTDNYTGVIGYNGSTSFFGLCLDNINTASTCPASSGGNASILADDAITALAFDFAEVYSISGPSAPGDVLVMDKTASSTVAVSSGIPYDKSVIGVVSTKPGFVLGWGDGARVALSGRIPTNVNLTNGNIAIGDPLTSSGVPGQAMKATKPGMILGYALEDTSATGTVEMFVNVGYWAGNILTTDGLITELADDVTFTSSDTASASNSLVNSWGLTFRGGVWDGATSSTVNQSFTLMADMLSTTSSRFTINNTSGTGVFSVNQEGDATISGRLYPSARGVAQNDFYIFLDNTLAPTSTYISTNADGWQSLDTYDFAERFPSEEALEPGDLVVVKDSGARLVQRTTNATDMVLGIVSTRPAFIAGRPGDDQYPIALSGRVPTKVSGMNGAILAGDALAPSSIPGVAVKATQNGPMVGLALNDYDSDQVGEIEVFVNPGWWGGAEGAAESGSGRGSVVQGFALIASGETKVNITFPSIGAYPNVFATPQGQAGEWWTGNYSDQGFDVILAAPLPRDVMFSWSVQPLADGNILYNSDGTYDAMDALSGLPLPKEEIISGQ